MLAAGQALKDEEQMVLSAELMAVVLTVATVVFVVGSNESVAPMSAVRQLLMVTSVLRLLRNETQLGEAPVGMPDASAIDAEEVVLCEEDFWSVSIGFGYSCYDERS
jgi:hypothetical protein